MLMPLAIIFGLWLHINRLNRSNWITNKSLSIIIIVSLIVISLIKPALSVESAKMQIIPKEFTMIIGIYFLYGLQIDLMEVFYGLLHLF